MTNIEENETLSWAKTREYLLVMSSNLCLHRAHSKCSSLNKSNRVFPLPCTTCKPPPLKAEVLCEASLFIYYLLKEALRLFLCNEVWPSNSAEAEDYGSPLSGCPLSSRLWYPDPSSSQEVIPIIVLQLVRDALNVRTHSWDRATWATLNLTLRIGL